MDCEKVIEIYNHSCSKETVRDITFLVTPQLVSIREQQKANCLKSMKLADKYCKEHVLSIRSHTFNNRSN